MLQNAEDLVDWFKTSTWIQGTGIFLILSVSYVYMVKADSMRSEGTGGFFQQIRVFWSPQSGFHMK